MLTSINLRVTVEHSSGLNDAVIQQRILEAFQALARQGTLLAGYNNCAVERTFTDAQRAALLEALDTEAQGFRDSLRCFDLPAEEVAGLKEELAILQDVRDRVEE